MGTTFGFISRTKNSKGYSDWSGITGCVVPMDFVSGQPYCIQTQAPVEVWM